MGRSKKSASSLNTSKNTPKVIESVKNAAKRPLPSESDTGDEDDSLIRTDSGFPTGKKGKFVEDDDSASYEEGSQDDVDDDDDNDEKEDESDEEEDESDEDDEDDDDDDDDSEDGDLQESGASDDLIDKTPAKNEKLEKKDAKNGVFKNSIIKTPTSGELVAGSAKKSNNKELDKTPKVSRLSGKDSDVKTSPSMTKTSLAHLVVVKPPTQLGNLRTAIANQGVKVEDVHLVNFPMAVVTCSADSADKIVNTPVSFDGNTLHVLRLQGSSAALDALIGLSTALFVTGLPKSVTEEQIKAALPKNSQPISLKLLTEGSKNKFFNAARLEFSTAKDAATANSKLSSINFENHPLRISFVRGFVENKETSELRGKTKTLLAVQLHSSITEAQLKSVFNTAVKLNLIAKGFDQMCYIQFSDPVEATSAYDALNGSPVGQSKLVLRFVPTRDENTLLVSNVPFESTSNDLLKIFPGASAAVMTKRGYYVVHFTSARARSEAASSSKNMGERRLSISCDGGLDHNICLLRNLPFEAKQSDIEGLLPTASSVEVHYKYNGRSTGNATVTFPTASACKEAMKKRICIGNRTIAISLKRVSLDDSESLDGKRPAPSNEATCPAKKQKTLPSLEKKLVKQNVKVPPQVGSASEDDDEDEEDQVSGKAPLEESDEGSDSEEDEESGDEDDEDDDVKQDEDDGSDDDDDEENSEESDEDTPMPASRKQAGDTYAKKMKFEPNGKFQKGSNFNKDTPRGGGGFKPQQRGRGGGFHRGGGDFGGHQRSRGGGGRGHGGFSRGRGGGDRGRGGGAGGFRGHGKFNNRGGNRGGGR